MIALVLSLMAILSDGKQLPAPQDVEPIARAIAGVVESQPPLFHGKGGKDRTAALLVAIAWRESAFRLGAIGDHGASKCAMQIMGGSDDLLTNAAECVGQAYAQLAWSVRYCPDSPVAGYAGGPGACLREKPRKISADRMQLAKWVLGKVAK